MKSKMKKMLVGTLAAVMVLSVGVIGAFAAEPGNRKYFVDADHDGICDRAGSAYHCTETKAEECVDADAADSCDHYRIRQRRGFGSCHNR